MAHGYPDGKYRGGDKSRSKSNDGPGKNAQHGDGGQHSQKQNQMVVNKAEKATSLIYRKQFFYTPQFCGETLKILKIC